MSMTEALALHDQAASLERVRFEVSALVTPYQAVTPSIRALAVIVSEISDEVSARMQNGGTPGTRNGRRALVAYSDALDPLGEAIAELGRARHQVTLLATTEHRAGADIEDERYRAAVLYTDCLETAVESIDWAVQTLREAAARLSPPSVNVRQPNAALARSPRATTAAAHPATPLSPAAPTTVPAKPNGPAHAR